MKGIDTMKDIYDVEQSCFIKGKTHDFQPTSVHYHLRALDEDEVMNIESRYTFKTFDELYNWVEKGNVLNATANSGIFGRYVQFTTSGIDRYTVRERNYKEVTLWMHCKEYSMSMEQLFTLLPAADLIEYLKERGIGVIENRG